MRRIYPLTLIILLFSSQSVFGQQIRIGLFRNDLPQSVMLTPLGNYKVFADSSMLGILPSGTGIRLILDSSGVRMNSIDRDWGAYSQLLLVPNDSLAVMKIKGIAPVTKERSFGGKISIDQDAASLRIINHLDLEEYLAGVVEAEAGYGHHIEFYKAQAIISRTYALAHLYKHLPEGFHLCDQVHCQAYKGKGRSNADVLTAAKATRGIVIVDDSLHFITAAFHSNCGGQTANSEHVWTKPLPYLRSVKDNYCTSQPNAYWTREISIAEWKNYLKRYNFPVHDSSCITYCTSFKQPYRMYCLSSCNKTIPFKNIRADFGLKSAFFSLERVNEHTVVLRGRGFGHGVGLCQEGAMKMAKLGFDFKIILKHYFTGVHIIDIREKDTFAEE